MVIDAHLISIIVAVIGSNGLWQYLIHLSQKKSMKETDPIQKLENKLDENIQKLNNTLDKTNTEITNFSKKLEDTKELSLSTARDRVNSLCNEYMAQGCIPQEDYDSFMALGNTYIKNGNTSVKDKFEYCKNKLPVK